MISDEEFRILQREAVHLSEAAPWLKVELQRDAQGNLQAKASVAAEFAVDPTDLAGSLIREIHRRLDEFDNHLDE